MRITKQQVDANKTRVVETAAALFREKGFDKVSVADLMHAAGLTHGGFYNHFGSKDDLEAAACAFVFEQSVAAIEAIATIAAPEERMQAFDAYRRRYVSKKVRDYSATACPMVAFAGDVSRQPAPVREEYASGFRRYLAAFERASAGDGLKGAAKKQAREKAIAQFATLAGARSLARSVAETDPALSDEILEAALAALGPPAA
ncbi:TetR/AcrR family transcriptional regulator [Methylocapsa sp. S129]|uniref:TetR/AcrR family transcriptional regulator n=1 Tax=Methylocapsa sp. S129 TaxID=1641869 RepID=UPI00131E71D8|nr:TetR/AcrR family transcriptional regulator [Methylocapsa sp. S129]